MALTEEQIEKLKEGLGDVAPTMRSGRKRKYPGLSPKVRGMSAVRVPEYKKVSDKYSDEQEVRRPLLAPVDVAQPPMDVAQPPMDVAQPPMDVAQQKQMASSPYEISDSTLSPEAMARFNRQPTAPGTRMRSGPEFVKRPEGGWHPDYSSGSSSTMRPEPPRSIGDIQRYQREVGEQEREAAGRESAISQGIEAKRADIAGQESAARTGIAQEESAVKRASAEAETLSATQKQGRIDTLMKEYDDPKTTPKRRAMIERQTAMLSGRALPKTERDKGIIMKSTTPKTIGPEGEELGGEITSRLVNPYTGEDITPTAMTPLDDRVEGETTHKIGDSNFVWRNGGWRLQ